jgi:hypothetical protein
MNTRKTVLGPEHPDTLTSMWNLAHTLKDQGRHAEAIVLLEICVPLQQKCLGQTHPDTTRATSDIELWRKTLLDKSHLHSTQSDKQKCLTRTVAGHGKTMTSGHQFRISIGRNPSLQNALLSNFQPLLSALRISFQPDETSHEDRDEID